MESKNTIAQIDAFLESHPEPTNDDYVITDTNPKDELGKKYAFIYISLSLSIILTLFFNNINRKLSLVAQDESIDDTIYELDRFLQKGFFPIDLYLKV